MRGRLLIAAGLGVLSTAGCTVGEGSGTATGMLWIKGCEEGKDKGSPDMPFLYDLEPTFFAGEPIGDSSSGAPQNRLIIRVQHNGNAVEINDTLYFDIPSSYQVARCLRGAFDATGQPDWDQGTGTVDMDVTLPWCEPNGPNGRPRIRVIPFGPVRAALAPLFTCQQVSPGPSVVSITGVAKEGWIEFTSFGDAVAADVPPDMRQPIDTEFKVDYGDPLDASFDLVLDDDRTVTAAYKMIDVPPAPGIGGTLAGEFHFTLERGRSAQTFP
jgi:hypothetical protein